MNQEQEIEYLIEGILPRHLLSIIAGPSGAGKTTFLFNLIKEWSQGLDFLGHKSNPEPYMYLSLDRGPAETNNRIRACGLEPKAINHLCILDEDITLESVLTQIPSGVKVIFIDGFARLCPNGRLNDYRTVSNFCAKITKKCIEEGYTILALAHATKVKEGESFLHPRHRVLGSVAWGGFSSTLIFIDETQPDNTGETTRRVEILPRTAKAEEHIFQMDANGSLVKADLEILAAASGENQNAIKFYTSLPWDEELRGSEIMEYAKDAGVGKTQLYTLLGKWVTDGTLIKSKHGCYMKESSLKENGGKNGLAKL